MKKKIPMIYSVVEQKKTGETERGVKMFFKGKEINLSGGFEMQVGTFTDDLLYSKEEIAEAVKKYKLKEGRRV